MASTDGAPDRAHILLMRHARHRAGVLTAAGKDAVTGVARGLAEWTDGQLRSRPHLDVSVFTTTSPEVRETAEVLTRAYQQDLQGLGALHPAHPRPTVSVSGPVELPARPGPDSPTPVDLRVLGAYDPEESQVRRIVEQLVDCAHEGRLALLVGNDPLVSWVAAELVAGGVGASALRRRPVPVARGELICLSRAGVRRQAGVGRWRVAWNLAEEDPAHETSVREKIKSKMTTAAALGTVIVGLATFLLQSAFRETPTGWHWLGLAALGLAAALYFATLFLYDSLQMPTRFWGSYLPPQNAIVRRLRCGTPVLRRPPSSTARVLQASMVHVWRWIFTPATVLMGVGVAFLALGAVPGADEWRPAPQPGEVALALGGLVLLVAVWIAWYRPDLGSSD